MIFFSAGVSSRWPRPLGGGALSGPSEDAGGDDGDGGGGDNVGGDVVQAASARPAANATISPRLICGLGGRGPCLSLLCIIFSM
jgi:hypothetical protein